MTMFPHEARYRNIPSWPKGLQNQVWDVLVKEGADLVNVDHLDDDTKKDLNPGNGGNDGRS